MSKVVVITGGGNGFGKSLVQAFLERNWKVITTYHSHSGEKNLKNLKNINLAYCYLDLAEDSSIKEFIDFIKNHASTINCLVNNAATARYIGPILKVPIENWNNILKENFISQHSIILKLINENLISENGSIINITSRAASKPFNFLAPYGVSKAALETYTLYLANELREKFIRVNSVGLSADTNLYRQHAQEKAQYGYMKTLERIGNEYMPPAEHSIYPVLFLASEKSRYITGQHIEATTMEIPLA